MIKKYRKIPQIILVLEALLRRIHPNHPSKSKIEDELRVRRSGYHGELQLDYYMAQLPRNGHYILHDLRLPFSNNAFFQIDTLLLSNRFFTNYEAKNHAGTLVFEEQQMIQTYEGRSESYPNPIVQAENQQYHLENLIRKYLNITLPSTSFVVVTNPSSIIKFDSQYEQIASQKVIRPSVIRQKSELFWKNHQEPLLSNADLQKICRLLLKFDTPLKIDAFKDFHVKKSDLYLGAICMNCTCTPMTRRHGTWKCRKCGFSDKMAHIPALIDHLFLFGDTITNRRFRHFLQFDSVTVAKNLLGRLGLPFDGTYKDRRYYLSLDMLRKWV